MDPTRPRQPAPPFRKARCISPDLQVGSNGEIFCTKISQSDSWWPNTPNPTQHSWFIRFRPPLCSSPTATPTPAAAFPGTTGSPTQTPPTSWARTPLILTLNAWKWPGLHSIPSPATRFERSQRRAGTNHPTPASAVKVRLGTTSLKVDRSRARPVTNVRGRKILSSIHHSFSVFP